MHGGKLPGKIPDSSYRSIYAYSTHFQDLKVKATVIGRQPEYNYR